LPAVCSHREPLLERIANQFDPMGLAASAFQADAEIRWQSSQLAPSCGQRSKREFDPELALSIGVEVQCGKR
jgi:hypothetical protein